jgi:hypothetical protein
MLNKEKEIDMKHTLHVYMTDKGLIGDLVEASATSPSPTLGSGSPLRQSSDVGKDPGDIAREKQINDLVAKQLEQTPGITFRTAYMTIMQQRPDLFPAQQNMDVREKNALVQQTLMDEIKKLRAKNPHLTFVTAWDKLARERPSLFSFQEVD